MKFIITLIALMIERFFDWNQIRHWDWFSKYVSSLGKRFSSWPSYLTLALAVLPPVILVGLIDFLISGWLYGVVKLLFGILILMYCLGPINFWSEAYTTINTIHANDLQPAMERAHKTLGVTVKDNSQSFHRALINALFNEANKRIFAVIIWFILLGPAGAVLYRLTDLCRKHGVTMAKVANQVICYLDWIPIRILTLLFALAGHFKKVTSHWRQNFFSKPNMNSTLLNECGVAALDVFEAKKLPEGGAAEKETISLLDRSFVIGLVILAIIVLI